MAELLLAEFLRYGVRLEDVRQSGASHRRGVQPKLWAGPAQFGDIILKKGFHLRCERIFDFVRSCVRMLTRSVTAFNLAGVDETAG